MKFYAVKKGTVRGIYTTWSECQAQIKGYSGAVFKSFYTRAEAEEFMKDVYVADRFDRIFYTDGSFRDGISGGSAVDVTGSKIWYRRTEEKELQSNSRGELLGIILAIQHSQPMESVIVNTDSQYCINVLQNGYSVKDNLDLIGVYNREVNAKHLKVFLQYVPAHTGIKFNETADQYAAISLTAIPGTTHEAAL
jgi:ribonuclease H-related protein